MPPPPSGWLKLFPSPLFVGVKLHWPPSCFVAPLPVISDHSLRYAEVYIFIKPYGRFVFSLLFSIPPPGEICLQERVTFLVISFLCYYSTTTPLLCVRTPVPPFCRLKGTHHRSEFHYFLEFRMSSIFKKRVFFLPKYSQFGGKGLFLAVVTQFESSGAISTL